MSFSLALLLALGRDPDFRLPALLSDHMVVQRNSKFKVWGWDTPGSSVTIRASWAKKDVVAFSGRYGEFSAEIPTGAAGGPYKLTVEGSGKKVLEDVMVGDVWVCSGQSNMEWPLAATDHATEDIAGANQKRVRLFQVTNAMKTTPQADCEGSWQTCSPETVRNFSAVGYLFGKELNAKTGVPIGLIDTTWGGTEAELWTSEQGLMRLPDFAAKLRNKTKSEAEAVKLHAVWEKSAKNKEQGFGSWMGPDFDDSKWTRTEMKPWSSVEELKNFDGSCWYRAEFNAPAQWAGKDVRLQLGVIDDDDTTWVNGIEVGSTKGWNTKRSYTIPGRVVLVGRNVVTVRVWDGAGEGGWSTPEPLSNVSRGDELGVVSGWRYKIGVSKADLPIEPATIALNNSMLFNGMIEPLVNFPIKGAIWYQGESNVGRAFQYRSLFPAMIQDWRRAWKLDFPFYFVQIAPFKGYGSSAAAELREAQNYALKLPKTGVAVITDATGNLDDIHPQDKRTVGHRLALWALAKDYGQTGFEYSGPLYSSMTIIGSVARLNFSHAKGLRTPDNELREFETAGADKVFHKAFAWIEGVRVFVESKEVRNPVAVRMGWSAAPQPNLFNRAGLPASPFRTDNWPGLTDSVRW